MAAKNIPKVFLKYTDIKYRLENSEEIMSITYVITETQNGEEIAVWETYSLQHACAIMLDYTKEDKKQLSPCIYKKYPNGDLTTEY